MLRRALGSFWGLVLAPVVLVAIFWGVGALAQVAVGGGAPVVRRGTTCTGPQCSIGFNGISTDGGIAVTFGGMTVTNGIGQPGVTASISSGANAFAVATNGSRIDFGSGSTDYASSDGTTITYAGPVTVNAAMRIIVAAGQTALHVDTGDYITFNAGEGAFCRATTNGTSLFCGPDLVVNSSLTSVGNIILGTRATFIAATPTLTSFGGTGTSIVGSGAAFDINVGTVAPGSTGTVTFGTTATNGYVCQCDDVTTTGTNRTIQTGGSATTCTIGNFVASTGIAGNWTASDHIRCIASAY